MSAARHLVARQTVEIVAADRAEADLFSARTSRAAGMLAAAVERSLDAVEAGGLDLRIDRLELDLGPCDPARWEDALAEGIGVTLATKVAEAVDRGEAVHRDAAAAALLLLGEFARSGRLPWWAAGETPESAIVALASAGCDPEAMRAILRNSEAIERFVHQLDERSLLSLVRLATPGLHDDGAAAISTFAEAHQSAAPTASARVGRMAVWRAILAEAAPTGGLAGAPPSHRTREAGVDFERFLAAVTSRLGMDPIAIPESDNPHAVEASGESDDSAVGPDSASPSEGSASALPERLRALGLGHPAAAVPFVGLAALAAHLDAQATRAAEAVLDHGAGPAALPALIDLFVDAGALRAGEADHLRDLIAAAPRRAGDDADRSRDPIAAARAHAVDDAHDAVSIANSGLVLLWPFLPQLFGDLGLLEGEQFRDAPAQHRAAALLHYLACGEAGGSPEYELPLAKVLAGLDIDAIHEPGEPLDALETGSADALLEAMLGHAPMLGRISLAGVREAFLGRPGLLSTRDGHWLLRVERRSIDILLDRLPWTFAWVRLPWMPEPLQVEW